MFVDELEEKWGKFKQTSHYWENCPLPFISEQARLNVLFEPVGYDIISTVFETSLQCGILPELATFYKKYNGCRLFFGSLNIYGLQVHPKDVFEPYDIVRENMNNNAKLRLKTLEKRELVAIGSLGGEYLFSYKVGEERKIYCTKAGSKKIIKEYDDFNVFFNYFFEGLLAEYDIDGRKVHPNPEDKGIPVLEHLTYKLF